MKKNKLKLISTGIMFFIAEYCFSQSAGNYASMISHSTTVPDTSRNVAVTSAVKMPVVTNKTVKNGASVDNSIKEVHVTLQKTATLDPNRSPIEAIPANQNQEPTKATQPK